jgi:hypothetical protein
MIKKITLILILGILLCLVFYALLHLLAGFLVASLVIWLVVALTSTKNEKDI